MSLVNENQLRGALMDTKESKGALGFKGERGYSAYEIAVQNGYEGTEQQWIDHFGLDLTGYLKTSDIINNTYQGGTKKSLSAEMGKSLNTMINDVDSKVGLLEELETTDKTSVVNAINELHGRDIYSTTETVIGEWIDGKPLYRKVYSISGDMTASAWTTLVSITNVDTLTKGLIGGSSNNCVWNDVMLRATNNNLQYYSSLTHSYSWVTIEYTKTTD